MSFAGTATQRYDTTTIFLHWATAFLVAFQWLEAQIIDWFPRGTPRVDARSVHIACGALLAMILVTRLIWRATGGRRLASADSGWLKLMATGMHWALYCLLGAMLLVGMLLTWARGDSIFNLFSIPTFDPSSRAPAEFLQDVHATIGWVILALAGVHAMAALGHRYLWHDDVLARMLPERWRRALHEE